VFEVRHALSGDPFGRGSALAEAALNISILLAMVIGLERLRAKSGSVVHNLGALILAGVVLAMIVSNLAIDANPLLTGEPSAEGSSTSCCSATSFPPCLPARSPSSPMARGPIGTASPPRPRRSRSR
jgi:hypothetical protein